MAGVLQGEGKDEQLSFKTDQVSFTCTARIHGSYMYMYKYTGHEVALLIQVTMFPLQ